MGAIIATLRRSGLSFYFYLRRCRMPVGTKRLPGFRVWRVVRAPLSTLAFAALVFALWPWELKNRGGNYDLAAMVTMRRRHMKRTIKE
jgi:hypothetical protein